MRSKRRKEFIPIISAIQELTVTIDAYVSVDTGSFSVIILLTYVNMFDIRLCTSMHDYIYNIYIYI